MDINHGDVYSIYKNPESEQSLPLGDESPYAILVFDSTLISHVERFRPTVVDRSTNTYLEREIKVADINHIIEKEALLAADEPPFLLDMVVYGRKVPVTSCKLFDSLWKDTPPIEGSRKYLIRDWDIKGEIYIDINYEHKNYERRTVDDYSLNRCTSSATAFSPSSYQYDKPSPGKNNPCEGVAFFIEDYIDKICRMETCSPSTKPDGCTADHPSVPVERYFNIREHRLAELRENLILKQKQQPDITDLQIDCVDEAMEISINEGIIRDYGGTPTEYKMGGSSWDDQWIADARKYIPDDGMMLTSSEIQQWLRIQVPGESTPVSFHCAVCQAFFKDEMGNVLHKKHIQTEKGYFNARKDKNAQHIRQHMTNDVHISAMNYQYQLAMAKSQQEVETIKNEFRAQFEESLGPTAKMIRTVFTEIITETPFMYHEHFVNLQRSNGVQLGTHHYHDKAAGEITKTISYTMHNMLLAFLVDNNKPFSLTVDTSTTSRNVPLLIVYITTLEDGYPTTYFYRIIELEKGESAENTFHSFWNQLVEDDRRARGFLSYFVSKIAFFVSDSASVMTGINNSFYTKLRDKTPAKKLGKVGCLAHKLALVVKAAVRDKDDSDLEFIKKFEKDINLFYNFYHSRGSKRFQHLAETAEKYDMKLYRMRQNIEVRWAAAEYEVVNNIVKGWELLVKDLKGIHEDTTNFLLSARTQANNLYNTLTDIKTCLFLYDFLDLLSVNSIISKQLQSRASILPDHAFSILTGFTNYWQGTVEMAGDFLKKFILQIKCDGICDLGKCVLAQVEICKAPIYVVVNKQTTKEYALTPQDENKYEPVRRKLYTKLFDAMKDYFDFDLLQAVQIFDHRLRKPPINYEFYTTDFKTVCLTFSIENENSQHPGINCEELSEMALKLVKQLIASPTYSSNFGDLGSLPPSQFWPYVLKNPTKSLDIPPKLQIFFEYLLVFTDSSAEAERGFSIVNRVSKDARSNMAPENIDNLIRIKLNANKPVEGFKAFHYAKEFVKAHFPVDSEQAGGRPVKKPGMDPHRARVSRLF